MKLLNEKIDRMHFVRLGYDSYSESYIAHQTDGANDWYYKISEELYYIFDKDRGKYLEQIEKILELREKSEQFYFSYIHNLDLCQYFGHKKLNFSPSITYAERIIS